jgi:DNA-binding NarL/FixJ family response regulator
LLLTEHSDDELFFLSIKAGAQGYLLKTCHPEELVRSIMSVYSGIPAFNQAVAWRILRRISETGAPDPQQSSRTLSQRELDVLRLLTLGRTDQEIGENLFITPVTARTHINRILIKLGLKNRVEATLYGPRQGLVSLSEGDCL